jgi:hypothetical protein
VLSAESGSYVLNGTAVALVSTGAFQIAAEAGAYALTGGAAGLTATVIFSVPSGDYDLAGEPIVTLHSCVLQAGGSAYALTGINIIQLGEIEVSTLHSLFPRYSVEVLGLPTIVISLLPRYTVEVD